MGLNPFFQHDNLTIISTKRRMENNYLSLDEHFIQRIFKFKIEKLIAEKNEHVFFSLTFFETCIVSEPRICIRSHYNKKKHSSKIICLKTWHSAFGNLTLNLTNTWFKYKFYGVTGSKVLRTFIDVHEFFLWSTLKNSMKTNFSFVDQFLFTIIHCFKQLNSIL